MIMHLPPREDPSLLLKKLDEDFVRKNPLVREEVLGELDEQGESDLGKRVLKDVHSRDVLKGLTQPHSVHVNQSSSVPITQPHSIHTNPSTSSHAFNHPDTKRIRVAESSSFDPPSYASDEEMNALPQMRNVGLACHRHAVCTGRAEPNPLHSQLAQVHYV